VADVGGLVGIDAGVLDQNLSGGNVSVWLLIGGERNGHPGAIDFDIQVSRRRDLHSGDALDGADFGADSFGDLDWSGAQWLGKGKDRDGEIAQFHLGRLFNDHARQGRIAVALAKKLCDALGQTMFEMRIQGFPLSFSGDSDFSRARGEGWFDARCSVPYDEKSMPNPPRRH